MDHIDAPLILDTEENDLRENYYTIEQIREVLRDKKWYSMAIIETKLLSR